MCVSYRPKREDFNSSARSIAYIVERFRLYIVGILQTEVSYHKKGTHTKGCSCINGHGTVVKDVTYRN